MASRCRRRAPGSARLVAWKLREDGGRATERTSCVQSLEYPGQASHSRAQLCASDVKATTCPKPTFQCESTGSPVGVIIALTIVGSERDCVSTSPPSGGGASSPATVG